MRREVKSFRPLYPKSVLEKWILAGGLFLFAAFALSGYLSDQFLDMGERYYALSDIFGGTWELLLYLFPNSLFLVLYAVLRSKIGAYLVIGVLGYFSFLWIGRFLSNRPTIRSALLSVLGYLAVSGVTFVVSVYAFFRA
jgi:hypothetical protein